MADKGFKVYKGFKDFKGFKVRISRKNYIYLLIGFLKEQKPV